MNILKISIILLFIIIISPSCLALSIKYVSHSPNYIDFNKNKEIAIKYTIDELAEVELKIYDDRDYLIKSIKPGLKPKVGENIVKWNGTDNLNRAVPPEAYRYTITATTSHSQITHDLSDLTGGEYTRVRDIKWDTENNNISYTLLKPARVNLRIGVDKNGPLLATISDWLSRDQGNHKLNWDGYDNSGVIKISTIDNYKIYPQAFTLSDNTILVGPYSEKIKLIENISWNNAKRKRVKIKKIKSKSHHQQHNENRGDFIVEIKLPGNLLKDKNGVPIVSGIIPIRFSLNKKDKARVLNDRFEPILFLDGKYITENEVGFFPMTWKWDPKDVDEGEHYLSVNLRGYDGHYGAASIKVNVQHK